MEKISKTCDPRSKNSIFSEIIPKEPKPTEKCLLNFSDRKKPLELDILVSEDGTRFIDVRNLFDRTGYCIYDPGFTSTAHCCSTISFIDGIKGSLQYRGFKISDLVQNCTYLEVCFLLIFGHLPSKNELKSFEDAVFREMVVHKNFIHLYDCFEKNTHPMSIMIGAFGALSAFIKDSQFLYNDSDRIATAIHVLAKMPLLAAFAFRTSRGLPLIKPKKKYSFVENFLRMMFKNQHEKWKLDTRILQTIEKILIVHAEHEQNISTCSVRIASSSISNPYACIAAGLASLWGPAHGAANEAVVSMLEEIPSKEMIPHILQKVKQNKLRLAGFGHRIYKNFDPRATIIKESAQIIADLLGNEEDKKLMQIALTLEQAVLNDSYFIEKKLYPNVDFYAGLILRTIGIPKDMYAVIFAVSRGIGWITHLIEARSSFTKIGRPRQIYVGLLNQTFKKMEDREETPVHPSLIDDQKPFTWPKFN